MPSNAQGLRLFTFAAPSRFYALTRALSPWLWLLATALAAWGLYVGFKVAPTDATQGEVYRIIYLHVPAAWVAMVLFLAMAFWAAIGWAFNARTASMLARAIAPTGALFTFIALWTGSLWGKPTWGTYWVWDARLTSFFLLFVLYLGYIVLTNAIEDARRSDKAGALLAIVGAVNVPIIYFSVKWWSTLHQGLSVSVGSAPKMAAPMLNAMLLMSLACWVYAFAVVFARTRALILERERDHAWVGELVGRKAA
jgi:heme exporter protein C